MLIERTDDGRGPFDGLTGKYTIYYTTRKHYILYKKCNDFAAGIRMYQDITLNLRTLVCCIRSVSTLI